MVKSKIKDQTFHTKEGSKVQGSKCEAVYFVIHNPLITKHFTEQIKYFKETINMWA